MLLNAKPTKIEFKEIIMNKQSRYNIWIDNILYNSFSNEIISFKKNEVESIKFYFNKLDLFEKKYPEIFDKFKTLGFIVDAEFDELEYILFKNRVETMQNKQYHLTINPTLQCNYKCWYCCVEEQNTKYELRRMNDETIEILKKHINYMIKVEKIFSLHLDWFGGEPLMFFYEVILPISKYALELCKTYNIPYTSHVTTNAYYIDDNMIDAFKKIKLMSFQIPIDGNEKKHNSVKNIDGIGHYKQILENINKIAEKIEESHITMRINYDKATLKNITDVINDIKPENRKNIVIDFQRVWQINLTKDEKGNNNLLIKAKQKFDNAGFRTNYFTYNGRNNFKCCYSDSFFHRAVNYDGKIFKCTARDYDDELSIGVFNNNGSVNFKQEIISKMFATSTFDNEKCLNCNILPMCFGPCVQKYYEQKIGISEFNCLHEFAEISLYSYIKDRAKKQINLVKEYAI